MSTVTFPDAAAVVITRLKAALPALAIHHEVPAQRPTTFIRVFRTGGPRDSLVVDGAQLTIESWAPDVDTAMINAQAVRARLNVLPDLPSSPAIYRIDEFSGPQELPDPLSGSRRVTWTAAVLVRGN